jgi:hypothetical protein
MNTELRAGEQAAKRTRATRESFIARCMSGKAAIDHDQGGGRDGRGSSP